MLHTTQNESAGTFALERALHVQVPLMPADPHSLFRTAVDNTQDTLHERIAGLGELALPEVLT